MPRRGFYLSHISNQEGKKRENRKINLSLFFKKNWREAKAAMTMTTMMIPKIFKYCAAPSMENLDVIRIDDMHFK